MNPVPVHLEPGMRVVMRYRLGDGSATDALGELVELTDTHAVVQTKRGAQTVPLDRVIAAKRVPAAPVPRRPSTS